MPPSYALLADSVLLLHGAIVVFIVLVPLLVVIGNRRRWHWVNLRWLRGLHLVAMAVVVLQAWLGRICGLTVLESWLRRRAGQQGYETGFIAHWVHQILFYDMPLWVFGVLYTLFGLFVLWTWWRYPP